MRNVSKNFINFLELLLWLSFFSFSRSSLFSHSLGLQHCCVYDLHDEGEMAGFDEAKNIRSTLGSSFSCSITFALRRVAEKKNTTKFHHKAAPATMMMRSGERRGETRMPKRRRRRRWGTREKRNRGKKSRKTSLAVLFFSYIFLTNDR